MLGVVLGADVERRRIDSDWYDGVVIAFAAVCERQIQGAEEGRKYWDRRAEFASSHLSSADSPGRGAGLPVLDRKKWE